MLAHQHYRHGCVSSKSGSVAGFEPAHNFKSVLVHDLVEVVTTALATQPMQADEHAKYIACACIYVYITHAYITHANYIFCLRDPIVVTPT